MHNAIKKAFTGAVVASTIAWSVGLSAIPFAAKAATSGTLVKASLPAVYYVGGNGKRYVFPNEKTYKTWYADFAGVQTITDAELAAMPIGGNVTYKPGARMVKITTDPKVYAVDASGTLRWVSTEAAATALYGASWNQMIDDVPDAFFTNYMIGADIVMASDFDPAAAGAAASSINVDKGLSMAGDGSLMAMLSSSQPMGGTLPLGAMGVNLLKFDVKNGGSSAVTVDSLTLRRIGAGVAADWNAIYVYSGNERLTTGRTINATSNEVTIGGLNLMVDAGASKSLWIAGDVLAGATPSNVHSFQLVSLTSGAVSASGLPVAGPSFTLSGALSGNMAIAPTGTLANVQAGEMGAKLGQFQLNANVEDQHITKLTLTYNGTVTRDNISNLVLKQAGNTVATAAAMNSKDQAVFVFDTPFEMERGMVRTFDLYGDVSGTARAAQNVNFYLDQNADLMSIGQTYGYGVTIASTYAAGAAGATALVEAGNLNITFNGPASHNVAQRAQDVELFSFTMSAQSNLEVRTTSFNVGLVGAANVDFSDFKMVDTATGQVVAGPYAIPVGLTVNMTEVINLAANQARTFKVTADVENTAPNNSSITVTLNAFGPTAIRNLDNSTYLTAANDIVPPGAIVGNAHTVKVPSLTVSGSSTPVAQTYIQGAQGAELAGVTLTAGDASDIKVTQVTLSGRINDAAGVPAAFGQQTAGQNSVAGIVLTASLWDGATQLGSIESPAGSNNTPGQGGGLVFDGLNLTIPAGQTKTLKVTGHLATALAGLNDSIDFVLMDSAVDGLNIIGGLTATDPDGNAVNASYVGAEVPAGVAINGPDMVIAGAGTLTVVRAPSDTESEDGLVVGSGSNVVLAKYKMTALNEELKLVKARFDVANAAGAASLSLYDGATLVGGPTSVDGNGQASFSGMNFVIPKDASKTLTVKANLNSVGASGIATGNPVTVTLEDGWDAEGEVVAVAGIDGAFEVRGTSAGSSTLIQEFGAANADNDLVGYVKRIVKTKPTLASLSLPSSVLSAGDQVVLRFSVSADAAGDVSFKKVVSSVTKSGTVTVALPAVANTIMKQVGGSFLLTNTTVPTYAAGVLTIVLDNEEIVAAGTTKSYEIYMNMTGAVASDSVSSYLLGGSAFASGTTGTAGGGVAGSFIWSDMSATAHDETTTTDWLSEWKVKDLPTPSASLVK